jgi:hypothetical protein
MVTVDAQEEWQDTGVSLTVGDDIVIEYVDGEWTNFDGESLFGPEGGASFICEGSDCVEPLPGYPQGALIGRIGFGSPFAVGEYLQLTANAPGMLQFRMNDVGTYDNKGSLRMRVTVSDPSECGVWLDIAPLNPGLALNFRAGCD